MSYSFDSYYTDRFGSEHEVRVDYSYSRAEYGFPATLELEAAWFEDEGCVLDQLTPDEYHGLEMRAWDDYHERGEREAAMREDSAEARAEMMREARYER